MNTMKRAILVLTRFSKSAEVVVLRVVIRARNASYKNRNYNQ